MAVFKTARKQFTSRKCHQFISFFTTRSSVYAENFLNKSQENHPKRRKGENYLDNAKPFSEIPHDKGFSVLRSLYNLWKYKGNMVQQQHESFKRFGPIYKENIMGMYTLIFTCDVKSIERLHQFEGNHPARLVVQPWKQWRQKNGHELGILTSQGEHWKRMRSLLEGQLMDPKAASMYTEDINDVVSDFIDRIRQTRKSNSDSFDNDLFNWSLETMGCILYEMRFGALSDNSSPEMRIFTNAVHKMFEETKKIAYMSNAHPKGHEIHDNAWEIIYSTTIKHVDNKLKEIECKLQNGGNISGFLSTLLASLQMPNEEVYANISELMVGAVNTTSTTMQWCLYELAKSPVIQEELADEQLTVLGGKGIPTYEHLKKMPILLSVIKETLRMYPTTGIITRTLTQDVNICGYRVPKGNHVVMSTFFTGRDEEHYPDPHNFTPNRWLRQGESTTNEANPFSYLPFGSGARTCIGKRIAQLKLQLLLARLVQEFRFALTSNKLNSVGYSGVICPENSIPLRFIDR